MPTKSQVQAARRLHVGPKTLRKINNMSPAVVNKVNSLSPAQLKALRSKRK